MPEKGDGSDVNGEVERFPEAAAQANAEIGSADHDGHNVEGDSADGVLERLTGRVHRVEEIECAEFGGFVEEKNEGMENGQGERDVAGEVVQAEIVEVAMRPLAHRTVTESH